MPELPEVETIVSDLRGLVVGKRIAGFESFWTRLTEPEPGALVAQRVTGARILAARRRGKFAVLDLDTGESLVISLRMTGRLLYRAPDDPADPHLRARIPLADGGELRFADTRKFGRIVVVPSERVGGNGERPRGPCPARGSLPPGAKLPLLERLGPEPLERAFTPARLARLLASRPRARIKPLLLDQAFLAGVGNIYANEALYRARIHPLRAAGALRPDQVRALHRGVRDALRRAIRLRGASIDDYRDARGVPGRMHLELLVHAREGEPCPRCRAAIRKSYVGGRGTYFCPRCQRAPIAGARGGAGNPLAGPRARRGNAAAARRPRP